MRQNPCASPSSDTEPDIATTIPTNPCKRTPIPQALVMNQRLVNAVIKTGGI